MTRAAAIALPGAEFNDFLFAPIGEDRNGMLVSVLSGLARLDVDPWQEAADLAQLPGETATQRLASLIGALRDGDPSYLDPRTIAMRLIALLPNRNGTKNQSQNTPHSISATINSRPRRCTAGTTRRFFIGLTLPIRLAGNPPRSDRGQPEERTW